MKISRREKILLVIAVYALMIFFGLKYIISPTQAELSKVKSAKVSIDQQVQKAVQDGKQNSNYQSAISRELGSYLQLEKQLPRDRQLVELVDQIGTMAVNSNVTLLSVTYTDAKQPAADPNAKQQAASGTSNMELTLSTSGTYYNLLSYLQDLEQSPRIIVVQSAMLSVGQKKEVGTAATPVQNTSPVRVIPEITKYDLGNVQMNLQITSYYDQTGSELDKLLSLEQIKILTGASASTSGNTSSITSSVTSSNSTAVDKNTKLVTDAVKKFWDKKNPSADWTNPSKPGNTYWNGKLLQYLEGKYYNTNMGKNVHDLVNPLAAQINPDSSWAGTAIFHWDRVLDMNMSNTVKQIDPNTRKVYTNVHTRDFFPVAVYITYLPNYAPDRIASLSASQKQAVMGSVIVWQDKNSKLAPVVYRIDEKGQLQDL
jgi:Tfp pilus assembly protein PilO